jgi:hypothetical protein
MGHLTTKDIEISKLRTRVLLKILMDAALCRNLNQFGAWINRESEKLGWPDTQSSNKWYQLMEGRLKKPPVDVVRMLNQIFPYAEALFHDGPSNLWKALWGDSRDPHVLWPLCRTRFSDNGPWHNKIAWRGIETQSVSERTFHETIREFEGQLLLAVAYDQCLTLNHLAEAVALYRLHHEINCLAVSDIDGIGAYRCIRICLTQPSIRYQLEWFDAYDFIRDELVNLEVSRLTTERSYFKSVGIEPHQLLSYAINPLSWIDDETRWRSLNLDWSPADPEPDDSATTRTCYYCGGNRDWEWGCEDCGEL